MITILSGSINGRNSSSYLLLLNSIMLKNTLYIILSITFLTCIVTGYYVWQEFHRVFIPPQVSLETNISIDKYRDSLYSMYSALAPTTLPSILLVHDQDTGKLLAQREISQFQYVNQSGNTDKGIYFLSSQDLYELQIQPDGSIDKFYIIQRFIDNGDKKYENLLGLTVRGADHNENWDVYAFSDNDIFSSNIIFRSKKDSALNGDIYTSNADTANIILDGDKLWIYKVESRNPKASENKVYLQRYDLLKKAYDIEFTNVSQTAENSSLSLEREQLLQTEKYIVIYSNHGIVTVISKLDGKIKPFTQEIINKFDSAIMGLSVYKEYFIVTTYNEEALYFNADFDFVKTVNLENFQIDNLSLGTKNKDNKLEVFTEISGNLKYLMRKDSFDIETGKYISTIYFEKPQNLDSQISNIQLKLD